MAKRLIGRESRGRSVILGPFGLAEDSGGELKGSSEKGVACCELD